MQYVTLASRCALGIIFVTALAGKLRNRQAFRAFRDSVQDMMSLPSHWATAASTAVVLAEASIVALLSIEHTVPAGFSLTGAVLLVFSVGLVRVIRSGAPIPCRCFGASAVPISGRDLLRNAILLATVAAGLTSRLLAPAGGTRPAGVTIGLACAGLVALTIIFFEDLADLWQHQGGY